MIGSYGQAYQSILTVSGIDACPWDGSQVGQAIRWPFLQISAPSLSLQCLKAEQILDHRFHGWAGVLIPSVGLLLGYRKWSLQVPYSSC